MEQAKKDPPSKVGEEKVEFTGKEADKINEQLDKYWKVDKIARDAGQKGGYLDGKWDAKM